MGYYVVRTLDNLDAITQTISVELTFNNNTTAVAVKLITLYSTKEIKFMLGSTNIHIDQIEWKEKDDFSFKSASETPLPIATPIQIRLININKNYGTDLEINYSCFGKDFYLDNEEDVNSLNQILNKRGLEYVKSDSNKIQIIIDELNRSWLITNTIDLKVSQSFILNNSNIEPNRAVLCKHPGTIIEQFDSISFLPNGHCIPYIKESSIYIKLNFGRYNLSKIEFVFKTPFESDNDIQWFLEQEYNRTLTTKYITETKSFFISQEQDEEDYIVSSLGDNTARGITPKRKIEKFEISEMRDIKDENSSEQLTIQVNDNNTYSFDLVSGARISLRWDGDMLILYDNWWGEAVRHCGWECKIYFQDHRTASCGYCSIHEFATMIGANNVWMEHFNSEHHLTGRSPVQETYHVKIYKNTQDSANRYLVSFYDDYDAIIPNLKMLSSDDAFLFNTNPCIDIKYMHDNNKNASFLNTSWQKQITNFQQRNHGYYYIEAARYSILATNWFYNNIGITNLIDLFTYLDIPTSVVVEEGWEYDDTNQYWIGENPLFVKINNTYTQIKVSKKGTHQIDYYGYTNHAGYTMIPYTDRVYIDDKWLYTIQIDEIALCQNRYSSYLHFNNLIPWQKDWFDTIKIMSGTLGLTTSNQYTDLTTNKVLNQMNYKRVNIPRYKMSENKNETYFNVLSVPYNRVNNSLSGQFAFSAESKKEESGMTYGPKPSDRNINQHYWTSFPYIYPEIVVSSFDVKDYISYYVQNENNDIVVYDTGWMETGRYTIGPYDRVVVYKRSPGKLENIETKQLIPWTMKFYYPYRGRVWDFILGLFVPIEKYQKPGYHFGGFAGYFYKQQWCEFVVSDMEVTADLILPDIQMYNYIPTKNRVHIKHPNLLGEQIQDDNIINSLINKQYATQTTQVSLTNNHVPQKYSQTSLWPYVGWGINGVGLGDLVGVSSQKSTKTWDTSQVIFKTYLNITNFTTLYGSSITPSQENLTPEVFFSDDEENTKWVTNHWYDALEDGEKHHEFWFHLTSIGSHSGLSGLYPEKIPFLFDGSFTHRRKYQADQLFYKGYLDMYASINSYSIGETSDAIAIVIWRNYYLRA